MSCLRRIKGVARRDRIRNVDIREEVGVRVDVVKRIHGRRLRYFEHCGTHEARPPAKHCTIYLATYTELGERVDHIKDGSTT